MLMFKETKRPLVSRRVLLRHNLPDLARAKLLDPKDKKVIPSDVSDLYIAKDERHGNHDCRCGDCAPLSINVIAPRGGRILKGVCNSLFF